MCHSTAVSQTDQHGQILAALISEYSRTPWTLRLLKWTIMMALVTTVPPGDNTNVTVDQLDASNRFLLGNIERLTDDKLSTHKEVTERHNLRREVIKSNLS